MRRGEVSYGSPLVAKEGKSSFNQTTGEALRITTIDCAAGIAHTEILSDNLTPNLRYSSGESAQGSLERMGEGKTHPI